jgi:hypothetical protein
MKGGAFECFNQKIKVLNAKNLNKTASQKEKMGQTGIKADLSG